MRFWCSVAFLPTERLLDVARWAEELGFEGVLVADHVVRPEKLSSPYPYAEDGLPPWPEETAWPDAWVAIAAMAAVTTRLRFSTNVYVAPARHAMAVAKAVSTAAVLSEGRVALGAGIGWMREDVEASGEVFERRGARLDEMIELLRLLWTGDVVEHHGDWFDFDRLSIRPVPPAPIPIWIGGESDAALRRAARCDGWIASVTALDETLDRVRRVRAAVGDRPFEILVPHVPVDRYEPLEALGVTGVMATAWRGPRPEIRANLESFAERYIG